MRYLNKKLFLALSVFLTPYISTATALNAAPAPSSATPAPGPTESTLLNQHNDFLNTTLPSSTASVSGPTETKLLNQYYDLQKSDPAQAKKILMTFIKEYPTNVTAQLEMGYLLIREKKNKEAIPYFQTAQKLDPSNQQTKRQLAYLLEEENQSKTTQTETQNASPQTPTDSKLLNQYYALKKAIRHKLKKY